MVGGVPCSINIDEANAINAERLAYVSRLLEEAYAFVNQVYFPDLLAVASFYKDWGAIGGGLSNYLVYGDLPTNGFHDVSRFKFPRGAILNRDLSQVHEVDGKDPPQVQEPIPHSWYTYSNGDSAARHPWEGETTLNYTGPRPPYEQLNVEGKYSWLKTLRWKGNPMEVGPLARMLVAYASGREEVKEIVDATLSKLELPLTALFSTLGRTAARGLETVLVSRWAREFFGDLVSNIKNGDSRTFNQHFWEPSTWPVEAKGVGLSEAPRGALAHWIVIKDKKIANYQLVVPSTWNASPRDEKGVAGPYEASLVGNPVVQPDKPLEVLRTVHSFDPCIACAVHTIDPSGNELTRVNVG